jgi:hypothetical protein
MSLTFAAIYLLGNKNRAGFVIMMIGNLRRLRIFGQQDKLKADRSKGRKTWA